jgi:hypothetical protein
MRMETGVAITNQTRKDLGDRVLLQAARESYGQVGLAHALKDVRVADVMTRDCPKVDGWLNVQNFVEQELLRTGRRCFMVVDKGEIT